MVPRSIIVPSFVLRTGLINVESYISTDNILPVLILTFPLRLPEKEPQYSFSSL
jgi:hypothetical protein